MNYLKTKKIIAAVLTAALAVSPVITMPAKASDGQDVETSASSWRYQDGDIVVCEDLNPMEADENLQFTGEGEPAEEPDDQKGFNQEGAQAAGEPAEPAELEDYNAQMGSSMSEEPDPAAELTGTRDQYDKQLDQTAEGKDAQAAAADHEQPGEDTSDGQSFVVLEGAGETPQAESQPAADGTETDQLAAGTQDPEEPATEPEQTEQVSEQTAAAPEETAQEPEQTEQGPMLSAMSATSKNKYWTWSNGKYKRGPGYLKGIDVSYWQGNINWKKVKAAGVDFAIIRCGYGPNTSSKDDSMFAKNVKGCKDNGIPYGVYLYSYANSVSKAKDEANHAIRLLKANKCKLAYPVYYDLEDKKVEKAGSATICKMANAFCAKLRSSGYPAGVYANLTWWNNKLAGFSGYDKWVAQWNKTCAYKKPYSIWQCTSSTHVNGISGRVDANLLMCPKADMDNYMKNSVVTYKFKTIDGKVYAVGSNGSMVKNKFFKIGGYLYAFDKNGVRQQGKKYRIGFKGYTLDKKGRAYLFKAKAKKKTPYYAKAGKGKKGSLKKGKTFYVLRTSGKWSQMANGYWVKTSKTRKIALYPTITPSKTVKYKAKVKKKTRSYSGPSSKYIKKKKFKKNKTVTVIGTYGSWSKLSTGQWLPSKRLKKK